MAITEDGDGPVGGQLPTYTCFLCGHIWTPRFNRAPSQCAKCKRRGWNKRPEGNPVDGPDISPLDRRLVRTFFEFRKVGHPARVGAILHQIETELRIAQQAPQRSARSKSGGHFG